MTHIRQRGDTAANWTTENPVLQEREVGWETNTRKAKLGDGVTAWNDLPYAVVPQGSVVTVAGKEGPDILLDRNDVGLGNVNNTSDTQKPVSVAQQAALDAKANLNSPSFTGNPTAPTPGLADDDTSIATTAFVKDAVDAAINSALTAETGSILIGEIRVQWGREVDIPMGGAATKTVGVVFPTAFDGTPTGLFGFVQTGLANKILANGSTADGQFPTSTGAHIVLKTADGSTSSATPSLFWLAFGPA